MTMTQRLASAARKSWRWLTSPATVNPVYAGIACLAGSAMIVFGGWRPESVVAVGLGLAGVRLLARAIGRRDRAE